MPDKARDAVLNRYGSIAAEIYDIDKPVGAMPDAAFYLARLAGVEGPVLEPACGSGRTLIPLLQAGHDATGFDTSPEMLEQCRARCAEAGLAPDLSRQTFTAFSYDRAFAAIVIPAASFTLIDRYDDATAALRRFRDHLASGGRLIFDVMTLAALDDTGPDRRRWPAANGDLLTLEGVRTLTDPIGQRFEALYRYERWRDGGPIETQLELMAYRCWGVEELAMTLREAGFVDVTVTGDYRSDRPIGARTRLLTYEARRP